MYEKQMLNTRYVLVLFTDVPDFHNLIGGQLSTLPLWLRPSSFIKNFAVVTRRGETVSVRSLSRVSYVHTPTFRLIIVWSSDDRRVFVRWRGRGHSLSLWLRIWIRKWLWLHFCVSGVTRRVTVYFNFFYFLFILFLYFIFRTCTQIVHVLH